VKNKTWVIVAESGRARIYEAGASDTGLTEIQDLVHPESRMHEQNITSDLPGRTHDRQGTGARHAKVESTPIKEHEAKSFAKEIASILDAGRKQSAFDKLVIMAPPAFLGLLRKQLSAATLKTVVREVDKNLLHNSPDEIRSYLDSALTV